MSANCPAESGTARNLEVSKSLVYFTTALRANELTIDRLVKPDCFALILKTAIFWRMCWSKSGKR
jgi:hypothetical protein